MQLNEFVETEELNEGLVFFKNSKRLFKLVNKINKKNKRTQDPEVKALTKKMEEVAFEFEDVEQAFKNANSKEDKEKIKQQYRELVTKYKKLIDHINKESVIKALKTVGAIGLVAFSVLALQNSFNFFANKYGGAEMRNLEIGQQLSAARELRPNLGAVEGALLDREMANLATEQAGLRAGLRAGRAKLAAETGTVAGIAGLSTLASKILTDKSRSNTVEDSRRTFQKLRRAAKRPA